jgi:hypothetical protein
VCYRRVGPRRCSSFISRAVERAVDDERRRELIESALGAVADHGHDWNADPASWVHEQRRLEEGSVG